MMKPTNDDIKFLFEGNETDIDKFVNTHKQQLDDSGIDYNELEDLKNEDLDYQRQQIFAFLYAVAIDWREYDDEIVRLLAGMIHDEQVEASGNDEGILVKYNGVEHQIKLSFSPADRYNTIRGFNKIIKEKYEARILSESFYSDTHTLLILPNETWKALEQQYPTQINEVFMVITETTDFP